MASQTRILSVLSTVALAGAIAGCGSSSHSTTQAQTPAAASTSAPVAPASSAATAKATTLHLTANAKGALMFDTTKLSAKAGTVTLVLSNPHTSGVPHAIAIAGAGVKQIGQIAKPGGSSTVTVALKHGTYTYFCPVPGHAAAGMKGTLVIS